MNDIKNSLEALKLALQTEEEGYKLYKSGADHSNNKFVKSIFQQLFKDELMHMDLIKRFYAHLNKSASWTQLDAKERNYKGLKGEIKTIFSSYLDKIQQSTTAFSDYDLDIYEKAIEFEKKGILMYDKLYKATSDDKAKKFYSFLRDMEQDHADILDNTFQYLKNPEGWHLGQEGWTMDY